jgi:hypothetical protein
MVEYGQIEIEQDNLLKNQDREFIVITARGGSVKINISEKRYYIWKK